MNSIYAILAQPQTIGNLSSIIIHWGMLFIKTINCCGKAADADFVIRKIPIVLQAHKI
jgi:hypothetical protein